MNAEELAYLETKNAEPIANGETVAYALSQHILWGDENAVRVGAARLLKLAVLTASLVEKCEHAHPEAFREASKKHPWYPVLIAGRGSDTKKKLKRIESFPIGEDWLFKRFKGRAQNDDLWRQIETEYGRIQSARLGELTLSAGPIIDKKIDHLPDLNEETAREWARVMAQKIIEGPRWMELVRFLKVNIAKETERRRRCKVEQMKKKFGGTKLDEDNSGIKPRYFSQTQRGRRVKELSSVEATWLEVAIKAEQKLKPTKTDKVNALTDAIEKRLKSRLKK